MRIVIALLVVSIFISCDENEQVQQNPQDYVIIIGDTTITIPVAAVNYAGSVQVPAHFNFDAYMLREFQIASHPSIPREGSPYTGSLGAWKGLPWNVRQTFLVIPYTRDISPSEAAQYYYNIGTHMSQFGYGWSDTYAADANLNNTQLHPWSTPSDTTLAPDIQGTLNFDGQSNFAEAYRAMWEMEY